MTGIISKMQIWKLYSFSLLIFLGIILRDTFEVPVNKYAFLVIVIFAYFFLKEGFLVAFIAFIIPFLPGLPSNFIIGCAIPFLLIKQKAIRVNLYVFAAYAFLLIEMFHLFSPLSYISNYVKFSIYILLITIILFRKNAEYNFTIILFSYAIGVVSSFTSIFINSLKYISLADMFEEGVRIGNIASINQQFDPSEITLSLDQNTLGYFCIIAIAVLLILVYAKKISFFIGIPLIILTLIYGSLTLSRTFIIISFGVFFYFLFANLKAKKESIKAISLLILVILFSGITLYLCFPGIIEMIIKRFEESDITNGRTRIFEQYNNLMFSNIKNFIFGIGIQNTHIKAELMNVPHNGIQQIFVSEGVLGLLLIIIWIFGMYINNRPKHGKDRFIYLLPFVTLFVYIQSIQFLSPSIIMLPLIVVFCALRIPCETGE